MNKNKKNTNLLMRRREWAHVFQYCLSFGFPFCSIWIPAHECKTVNENTPRTHTHTLSVLFNVHCFWNYSIPKKLAENFDWINVKTYDINAFSSSCVATYLLSLLQNIACKRLNHAIWTANLEILANFYIQKKWNRS